MPLETDADEDEDRPFDPNALTPAPELPPSAASLPRWLTPGEGEVWGDFRLGEMLGQGGMGMVFKAHQLSLNRTVALKVLTPYLGQSGSFRARFLREAQSVARIASPHVVQVYAAGSHADFQYFAMEFVEGEDLGGKLAQGYRPSRAEALDIITQAARGLVAAGEHDIVHRDIKPGNMMITRRGVVKLMDFGLVRIASEERMTTTGVVMGTPYYFSPEQARGLDCDQRADLYSLGIVFYELLTGELPFTGDQNAVVYAHINTRPRKPRELDREIPQDWQEVLLTCLAKQPEARYRNASELLRDLERLAGEQAPALVAPPRNPWPTRAAAVAAIVAAASVSAYAWRPQKPARTVPAAAPTAARAMSAAATGPQAATSDEPHVGEPPRVDTRPRRVPPAARPTVEPKLPSEPPTVVAPCETSVALRAPFVAGDFVAYRWKLDGAPGACGRLDAATTLRDDNIWTAPGRLQQTPTATVTGIRPDGTEVASAMRLVSAEVSFDKRHLQPFARWSASEPAAARLAQDARGRWWAADGAARRLWATDWLIMSSSSYDGEGAFAPPATLRARGDEVVALEATAPSLLVFGARGFLRREPLACPAPLDAAPTADGLLIVSDAERGLIAIDPDGKAFPFAPGRFPRIAVADDGRIAALEDSGKRIVDFDGELRQVATRIPVTGDDRAVDLAFHRADLVVLLASGAADVLPQQGATSRVDLPASLRPRGSAGALAIGAGGDVLASWPQDHALTRLPIDGWSAARRGGVSRQGAALAADACGRLWTIADDTAICRDAQGWISARIDVADIPQPEQLAVSPDGARLAIAGQAAIAVVDLTQPKPRARLLPTPDNGRWSGSPRIALDEKHRVYALDRDQRRVTVVDEGGDAVSFTCASLKAPGRIAVSASGRIAFITESDGSAVAKYLFADDHAAIANERRVSIADFGGKRADAIGCDLQAQVYLLDEGRAVCVCSWRDDFPVPISSAPLADLAVAAPRAMAVSPDGQVWLSNPDGVTGLRW